MTEMISLEEAQALVLANVTTLSTEVVEVLDAVGRVSAADLASDIDIAQMCLAIDARTPVDERSVESGLGIFEELGFCRVSGFDDTRRIAMAENPGRVQLSRSIRYLEGLRSRMEFSAFRSWALDSCASDMLAKVNRPIVPRA